MPKSSLVCLFVFICTFSFCQEDSLKQDKFVNIFGPQEFHSIDSFTTVSKTDNRLVGKWILKKTKTYSQGILIKEEDLSVQNEGFFFKENFHGSYIKEGDTTSWYFYWGITPKEDTFKIFQEENSNPEDDYRITLQMTFKIEKIRRNKLMLSETELGFTNKYTEEDFYKKKVYIYRRIRD